MGAGSAGAGVAAWLGSSRCFSFFCFFLSAGCAFCCCSSEDEPEPTESGQSDPDGAASYELPQPSGSSAAEGGRLNDQGKALIDSGSYDEAVPVLERSVRAFPAGTTDIRYAYALFNLGHALRLAGRPADAVVVLEERLKNPDQSATVERELEAARAEAASG